MGKLCKILLVSAMLLVGGCSSKESEKKEPVSDNTEKTTLKITIQDEVNKKELFNGNVSVLSGEGEGSGCVNGRRSIWKNHYGYEGCGNQGL